MEDTRAAMTCVNCQRSVEQVPLLSLAHRNGPAYICPQCLPVLIHNPHLLTGKLSGVEHLQPHDH